MKSCYQELLSIINEKIKILNRCDIMSESARSREFNRICKGRTRVEHSYTCLHSTDGTRKKHITKCYQNFTFPFRDDLIIHNLHSQTVFNTNINTAQGTRLETVSHGGRRENHSGAQTCNSTGHYKLRGKNDRSHGDR